MISYIRYYIGSDDIVYLLKNNSYTSSRFFDIKNNKFIQKVKDCHKFYEKTKSKEYLEFEFIKNNSRFRDEFSKEIYNILSLHDII
jgi:hypothetical protein